MSKRVFITGCSAGFGRDTARALAGRGHTVYATMRGLEGKNAATAAELRAFAEQGGHALLLHELDVTDERSVERAAAWAVDQGGVDVLVQNAGVGTYGVQETFTLEQVQGIFDVNVFGVLRVNRALLPHLRQKGAGRVVYLSSGLGRLVLPFLGPYTASKFALEALAQAAAYDLEPLGIESVIVQPGAFGTTFSQNSVRAADVARLAGYGPVPAMMEGFVKGFEARAKAGQIGNPEELVQALCEVVEAPRGSLPARRTVGADVFEAVTAINRVSEEVHDRLLRMFGIRK
jgi:NAD(P)-dependent dehydrogenase (short-subunit alcohol dehydrogenase family)